MNAEHPTTPSASDEPSAGAARPSAAAEPAAVPTPDLTHLSLAQKASLTSGASFWSTEEVPGVPSIVLTDGPHGVRLQRASADHLGLADSEPATCFPPAVTLGATFDPELLERVGVALGAEARALGVAVLLGPGINLKRSPLGGRNFEYFSEDPLVTGVMASALVQGLQSQGVGASLKHFAANNQESDRMRVSADIDERPLREVYLRAFEHVVRTAQPWTVMCSYNRLNGTRVAEDRWLLTTVLREEWGFEGLVVSDWGAVADRVASLRAGLDLEMPAADGASDARVVAAVEAGELPTELVDASAGRMARLVAQAAAAPEVGAVDQDAHHALAREAAAAGIVLLRNEDAVLPLAPDASLAVIGELARSPRYQGAGSSLVNPTRLDDALTAITAQADGEVPFAAGYAADGTSTEALRAEAVQVAASAGTVLLFLGVPAELESEGFDREDIELPAAQLALLTEVVAANPRTVVVLANGGVVRVSGFAEKVPALLEGWLGGQAGGSAVADVLFGAVNPSGRLTETIPLRLQDGPSFLDFGGEHGHARYGEGIFVGHRWFDARDLAVSYPFGHGLSYTTFAYADAAARAVEGGDVLVEVTVTNTGERAGAEVVQVYASLPGSAVQRAPRVLAGFAKVPLEPGESRRVEVRIARKDLAYWDTRVPGWTVEGGTYEFAIGASSRDLRASASLALDGDEVRIPLTPDSTIGEVLAHPVAGPMLREALSGGQDGDGGMMADPTVARMMESFPLGRLAAFPGSGWDAEAVEQLITAANTEQG